MLCGVQIVPGFQLMEVIMEQQRTSVRSLCNDMQVRFNMGLGRGHAGPGLPYRQIVPHHNPDQQVTGFDQHSLTSLSQPLLAVQPVPALCFYFWLCFQPPLHLGDPMGHIHLKQVC